MGTSASYVPAAKEAVYRVIRERRDVRTGFTAEPIPDDVLVRLLTAAHAAPSVGGSKPWDFVVVTSSARKQAVQDHVHRRQEEYLGGLPPARAAMFGRLRIDAIARTPVNVAVTCDPTRGGWYTLGALDESRGLTTSVGFAIQNMWLAARAEGIGLCLVGAYDERELVRLLDLPEHLQVVAYVCLGYVAGFPPAPELEQMRWTRQRPLAWAVHQEAYGRRGLPGAPMTDLVAEAVTARSAAPVAVADGGPSAVLVFTGGAVAPPVRAEVDGLVTGASPLWHVSRAAGAEVCVVDVGPAGARPAVPGYLPRAISGRDRAAGIRAVEVGIETARDFYAGGNTRFFAGAADRTTLPELTPGADPLTVLAEADLLDVAALAGCLLGAEALGVPVRTGGRVAGLAGAVASALAGAPLRVVRNLSGPEVPPTPFGGLSSAITNEAGE